MSRAPLDPELVDAALERVGEGVILINAEGEVLTLNRAARALFAALGIHLRRHFWNYLHLFYFRALQDIKN